MFTAGQLIDADGEPVVDNGTQNFRGCRDSEFDQYGDVAAFGLYPEVPKLQWHDLASFHADIF